MRPARATEAPAYWPDGTQKHRWRKFGDRDASLCIWCGNTKGPATQGFACVPALSPADPQDDNGRTP